MTRQDLPFQAAVLSPEKLPVVREEVISVLAALSAVMAIRMWSTLPARAAHDVTGESTEEAVTDASS
ncbi:MULTISPECIES: hypothetical protein [Nonomuraea]|uniref:Uncharacterized protein n=1 Tax=Nonomuraea ferruginea TaxID=46174 RepID=A0ABT4T6F9_9ACTN|nr:MULTISPECIES: hypothetical protein [Nonomuraea]MDA0645087.1 hypothetical protein [Nonomuraea ferruginea]TXK43319.1 hypothetical protein FR742_30415 [Nonomuraea sp. C10]